jgi:Cu-Zn family superoxide dismutase
MSNAAAGFVLLNINTGGPNDAADTRHAGDLGNLQSDAAGNCVVEFQDKLLTLHGPLSIVGRSVIMCVGGGAPSPHRTNIA